MTDRMKYALSGACLLYTSLRQLLYLFPGLLLLQEAHLRGLGPQNDIVQHREHVHQLEVLMHHTDPQRCCVVGVIDLYCLSIFSDLAFFRLVQTEQDGHQRGFTGAIFPQNCLLYTSRCV